MSLNIRKPSARFVIAWMSGANLRIWNVSSVSIVIWRHCLATGFRRRGLVMMPFCKAAGLPSRSGDDIGLANAPVENVPDLLEQQGVRTAIVDLPADVSGLTLIDRRVGPFVAVRRSEHVARRTFSFAHEYAHVLLDCDTSGIISRGRDHAELVEVRANAFAANLLMPEAGVRQFLATLGKAGEAKLLVETPTSQDDVIAMEARGEPASLDIQLHEIALLAHHFGVSRTVALYRVRNMRLISDRALKRLLEEEKAGRGRELAHLLELTEPDHAKERNRFRQRFLGLALEAFRREEISRAKLDELFGVLGRPNPDIPFDMLESLGGEKPTGLEIPNDEVCLSAQASGIVVTDSDVLINLMHADGLHLLGRFPATNSLSLRR